MSKAEIGDLIVYSAQSRWSPMKFGIVYGFNKNGQPMVWTEKSRYVRGKGYSKGIGKSEASSNYLVLRTADGQGVDERIQNALSWHFEEKLNSITK